MATRGCARLLAHPPSATFPTASSLVELAWRMVRFQPQYPPVRKRLAILAPGSRATGALRKKAIVAVARQLAVDLWRLNTPQTTAEKLGLNI